MQEHRLNPDEFPKTLSVIDRGMKEKVAPAFSVGIWSPDRPESVYRLDAGKRRIQPSELDLLPNTPFDLSSLTKVLATAPLVASLVERGWIRWETPLSQVLPGYPFHQIQIQHLLSHTAGLKAWDPLWQTLNQTFRVPIYRVPVKDRQEAMRKLVFEIQPDHKPGEVAVYSDITFMLLGFMVEELLGTYFDQAVKHHVWNRMETGLFFRRVTKDAKSGADESVAATEDCPWREAVLQGQVHDDNCWAMGGYSGHAGAFGSVMDVIQYLRKLFGGFLQYETLRRMFTRVSEPKGCERTLGWDTPSKKTLLGTRFSKDSVGHWGFTGTSLWIDLDRALAVVLLTNRVHPRRDNDKINQWFRAAFHDAVIEDWSQLRK